MRMDREKEKEKTKESEQMKRESGREKNLNALRRSIWKNNEIK